MEILHTRCAALDVSKKDAKVCVRTPGKRAGTYTNTVTTWGATTNQVLALRAYLLEQKVTLVVMEAGPGLSGSPVSSPLTRPWRPRWPRCGRRSFRSSWAVSKSWWRADNHWAAGSSGQHP